MAIEVFPVVNVQDVDQAVEQSGLVFRAGADGVFLIDHENVRSTDQLFESFNAVQRTYPNEYVGLNILQTIYSNLKTMQLLDEKAQSGALDRLPDGIWCDDASIDLTEVYEFREARPELKRVSYLGGVAFKGTAGYTANEEEAAHDAAMYKEYVDIVTTSGQGTGYPPSPRKIAAMKAAVGRDRKLAVASGISAENIRSYNGRFDQLLVASSLETFKYSGRFIPEKVVELVELAHSIKTS